MWQLVAAAMVTTTLLSGCSVMCEVPLVGTYEPECIKVRQHQADVGQPPPEEGQ